MESISNHSQTTLGRPPDIHQPSSSRLFHPRLRKKNRKKKNRNRNAIFLMKTQRPQDRMNSRPGQPAGGMCGGHVKKKPHRRVVHTSDELCALPPHPSISPPSLYLSSPSRRQKVQHTTELAGLAAVSTTSKLVGCTEGSLLFLNRELSSRPGGGTRGLFT